MEEAPNYFTDLNSPEDEKNKEDEKSLQQRVGFLMCLDS